MYCIGSTIYLMIDWEGSMPFQSFSPEGTFREEAYGMDYRIW
ncbi:MAG: hypothetical protein A4E36_01081 [Methanoregulaceae archaeon PtaB.Bin009]|nr:MAG: hypothetical protein A4E36_01081 [Methanoregulaceae archaeon PtaB.Bin009]